MPAFQIKGLPETQVTFRKLAKIAPEEARKVVQIEILAVQFEAKKSIAQKGSGRVYRKGSPTEHRASAPGDPPSTDYGTLMGKISSGDSISYERDKLTAVFGARNYAPASYLEFGTTNMAARPFMAPAAERTIPAFVKNMAEALKRAFLSQGPAIGGKSVG